ncbi:MAG TPA: phosphomannomutase/phosphoglucomutase [Mollicutes bacterium]|nr:phosphomannomutase/phosphoglucomutase [Mollicutes bacterium]
MDLNVLRENDIRGRYPNQINENLALRIGKAFGTYALSKKQTKVIVGHDNRVSGKSLHESLIKGLLSTGINVVDIGISTTPVLNFSGRELKIPYGIMITASHNASYDNGFKIFGEDYLHLEQNELQYFYDLLKKGEFITGKGNLKHKDLKKEYIKMLISKAKIDNKLKVVIDTGNGTPSIFIKDIFDNLNIDVTYLHSKSDGTFPVHNPDPNDEENLVWLKEKVLELGADVGLAFDGDGDRVGVLDEKGNMVATDILLGIFAGVIIPNNDNKKIIIDVKCSKALEKEIKRLKGEPLMLKNGSAYIETMVSKTPVLLGGEYSGHVFFLDDFDGYDDGIYAGIRLLNILGTKEKKCSQLYEHIPKYFNTPEIRIEVDDNLKWEIVNKIKDYAISKYKDVTTIDGVRVEYEDGFSLIRGSNTSPQITLRFESRDEKTLDLRKREFLNLLKYYIKN